MNSASLRFNGEVVSAVCVSRVVCALTRAVVLSIPPALNKLGAPCAAVSALPGRESLRAGGAAARAAPPCWRWGAGKPVLCAPRAERCAGRCRTGCAAGGAGAVVVIALPLSPRCRKKGFGGTAGMAYVGTVCSKSHAGGINVVRYRQ